MANIYDLSDTWNASGTTFTAIKMNVTDTASAAASLLIDLQVGGVSKFKVDKNGSITVPSSFGSTFGNVFGGNGAWFLSQNGMHTKANVGFSSASPNGANADLFILRDAANTLAQRNGVNAQAFNLYQSYTDASNYTRGRVAAASGIVTIAGESAGTGAADIDIALTPKGTGRVRYGTHAAIAAETVTGYIEIKDAGGTVRKIAVVS